MEKKVAIVLAKRTAIGGYKKSLLDKNIVDIATKLIKKSIDKKNINKVDEVIMGMVMQSGYGQNVARQISIKSGVPIKASSYTVNMVCGSGMKAVELGANSILLGKSKIVLVGGLENMSNVDYSLLLSDGLTDVFNNYHMGMTAENVAKKYGITREDCDKFSLNSTKKAIENLDKLKEEIVELDDISNDEHIRLGQNIEKLSKLKPAFLKDGVVTAGNATGLNDGVAILLLMEDKVAKELNLEILGYIKNISCVGLDPKYMGLGPVEAIKKTVAIEKIDISDIDLFEINEAFASQVIACIRELKIDEKKVNVNGGALALGHPIGASGARIIVTLINEMKRRNSKRGIASLCVGGGQGLAVLIER
ncbi:thiolase family protein [Sneathia sanguinegens]|uniref:Thiolase family protein n=1 Tax=Sneathia sanguinegens TaxID=40543 RepID=A0ABT7HI54_9FUSO|nr:thiolase family protein [Sneathia sanguinegens]MDK9580184.1 thiolase family protein [Sneathia sanguinegens]